MVTALSFDQVVVALKGNTCGEIKSDNMVGDYDNVSYALKPNDSCPSDIIPKSVGGASLRKIKYGKR